MQDGRLEARVDEVRRFNRFFTRRIGVLREGLLHSPYSLAEARGLFEVARGEDLTASELVRDLGLDPGYMSRILARFERGRLLERVPSEADGRRRLLRLTAAGEGAFSVLDRRAAGGGSLVGRRRAAVAPAHRRRGGSLLRAGQAFAGGGGRDAGGSFVG